MSGATLLAPAKLNLCLYLGPARDDGLHELVSLFEPIALADELRVEAAEADEVVCEGVEGPDLTERALEALREAGWDAPPLRVTVSKRIPVAAGLGGGSADAAALLRLAAGGGQFDPPDPDRLAEIAAALGADVPSQLRPGPALVEGAGERVTRIEELAPHAIVLVASDRGLATADVYAEADRLGLPRPAGELATLRDRLAAAVQPGPADPIELGELLVNDLQDAAISLRPDIGDTLDALREEGAVHAMVTGSGPTAFGLFAAPGAAHLASHRLAERFDRVLVTGPIRTVGAR